MLSLLHPLHLLSERLNKSRKNKICRHIFLQRPEVKFDVTFAIVTGLEMHNICLAGAAKDWACSAHFSKFSLKQYFYINIFCSGHILHLQALMLVNGGNI